MSELIKAGDLVIQVHSCCPKWLGRVFVVQRVYRTNYRCQPCQPWATERSIVYAQNIASAPVEWVKRIPPLSELEAEKQKEDLREPA